MASGRTNTEIRVLRRSLRKSCIEKMRKQSTEVFQKPTGPMSAEAVALSEKAQLAVCDWLFLSFEVLTLRHYRLTFGFVWVGY